MCHAEVFELRLLGCCSGYTAECTGSLDGEALDVDDFEDEGPRWDKLVRHNWYVDTGLPAPPDVETCRCDA